MFGTVALRGEIRVSESRNSASTTPVPAAVPGRADVRVVAERF